MKKKDLIEMYLSGQLIGDIIKNNINSELIIERTPPNNIDKIKNTNDLTLLHSTKGFLKDKIIGSAKTFFFGNYELWNNFKELRMNLLLNKFGYSTSDYNIDDAFGIIERKIVSNTVFGTIVIFEKIYVSNIY